MGLLAVVKTVEIPAYPQEMPMKWVVLAVELAVQDMILDGHVPPLAVAGFAQTLAERDLTLCGHLGRNNADVADHRQRPLLGLRCERMPPRRRGRRRLRAVEGKCSSAPPMPGSTIEPKRQLSARN